jgi:hypothetical protein
LVACLFNPHSLSLAKQVNKFVIAHGSFMAAADQQQSGGVTAD